MTLLCSRQQEQCKAFKKIVYVVENMRIYKALFGYEYVQYRPRYANSLARGSHSKIDFVRELHYNQYRKKHYTILQFSQNIKS